MTQTLSSRPAAQANAAAIALIIPLDTVHPVLRSRNPAGPAPRRGLRTALDRDGLMNPGVLGF